jgi:hypothetical protein
MLVSLLLLVSASTTPCYSDADSDRWKDWQITVSFQSFKPYLEYPQSPIGKLIKASVAYSQPANGSQAHYEDFYYTSSRVIGCRRDVNLGITNGTAGVIRINAADYDQTYAAANVVARLYLDLFLQRCQTKEIVVPEASFKMIVNSLCNQGFQIPPSIAVRQSSGIHGTVFLTVISDPPGLSQDVMM